MGIAFEEFWSIYPRKIGKLDAQKSYDKAIRLTTIDKIRLAAQGFASRCKGTEPQYIPHPATWLNQGRWDDQPAAIADTKFMPKQFPKESRCAERPRALTWANVFISADLPIYAAMLERANSFDTDPREFRHADNGIWVTLAWLNDCPAVWQKRNKLVPVQTSQTLEHVVRAKGWIEAREAAE